MTAVTHDIVAKLWNHCNVLKDDGVTYHQYVRAAEGETGMHWDVKIVRPLPALRI